MKNVENWANLSENLAQKGASDLRSVLTRARISTSSTRSSIRGTPLFEQLIDSFLVTKLINTDFIVAVVLTIFFNYFLINFYL